MMETPKRISVQGPDVFDVLSATWILASNDDNEIMTYEGVKYRLNLSKDYDIKGLIQSRGDLFRRGVPSFRLREWKNEMLRNKHIPSWIREIEDKKQRSEKIESLKIDDVFRSQFRAGKDSPRTDVKIIDWGLQHIDRLRKASSEAREQSVKSWQLWLVFGVGIVNIIVTVLTAGK